MNTDLLDVPHRREKQKRALGTGTDITERKVMLLSPGDCSVIESPGENKDFYDVQFS